MAEMGIAFRFALLLVDARALFRRTQLGSDGRASAAFRSLHARAASFPSSPQSRFMPSGPLRRGGRPDHAALEQVPSGVGGVFANFPATIFRRRRAVRQIRGAQPWQKLFAAATKRIAELHQLSIAR